MISSAAIRAYQARPLNPPSAVPRCGVRIRFSVYRAGGGDFRIELDFPERSLVVGHVLLQDRGQRLSLLRAQVDALKIADFDLSLRLLLHGAEHQEEIPDIHP